MKHLSIALFLFISSFALAGEDWALTESFEVHSLSDGCTANIKESESIVRESGNVVITLVKHIPVGVGLYPRMSQEIDTPEVTVNYIAYSPSGAPFLCDRSVKIVHTFHGVPKELVFNVAVKSE